MNIKLPLAGFAAFFTMAFGASDFDAAGERTNAKETGERTLSTTSNEDMIECTLVSAHAFPAPGSQGIETRVVCVTDDETFTVVNLADAESLLPGTRLVAKRSIIISHLLNLADTADYFLIPPTEDAESLSRTGEFRAMVVRVTSGDNFSPDKTTAEISDDVFGTNGDVLNLKVGYDECSGGKVNFVAGTGSRVTNGVSELTINENVSGVRAGTVESYVMRQLNTSGWDSYTHLLIILPSETDFGGALAYAYLGPINGVYRSVYKDTWGSNHMVLMHEIGHNFLHGHSGINGVTYADPTCQMGNRGMGDDAPRKCFNGAKSYYFGWYQDRHISITPASSSFTGKMLSIDAYLKGKANADDQYTVARVQASNEIDLFILFNRKEGINSGVNGYGDEVTITEQNGDRGSQSWIVGNLAANQEFRKSNWNQSSNDLVIKVCEIALDSSPSYARIIVYIENVNDLTCENAPTPTPPTPTPPTPTPPTPTPPTPTPPTPTPPTPTPKTSEVQIKHNEEYCVEVVGYNTGDRLSLRRCNSSAAKQFFEVDELGQFHTLEEPGMCIRKGGKNAMMAPCRGSKSTRWMYDSWTKTIHWQKTGLRALAVQGDRVGDGRRIKVLSRNVNANTQKWYVE